MKIVAWASLLSNNEGLLSWLQIQCIKESSTLRASPKYEKSSPRIVSQEGLEDKQVKEFLAYRRLIKRIMKKSTR